MIRLVKGIVVLSVLAFAGLAGYSLLVDLTPVQTEQRLPVTLNGG